MEQTKIIIENCIIGYWDEDFNPEEAIICFERLVNNSCMILTNKHNLKSEVAWMSFILPHISKLFNIDRNKLREQWVSGDGYSKCFKENKE